MIISVLVPCLNEGKFIEDCLVSILKFDIPLGIVVEVIVLDGGSTDETRNIVLAYSHKNVNIHLVDNPGRIQSCGLNIGIRQAKGKWIMRLDAHACYPPDYLRLCLETAQRTGADNVGGIIITSPANSGYEAQLVQAMTTHKFGVGNSGFRTGALEGCRDTIPFGFFRRDVFDKIGYFDERLVRGQDFEFNSRIRAAGGMIFLNPKIQSSYFNLSKIVNFFKKQFFKQGPYNAYMWYLAPYSFVPRHGITGLFALGFWSAIVMAPFISSVRYSFFSVMSLYGILAIGSAAQQAYRYGLFRHLACLPFCFFLFHICHGTGILLGSLKLILRVSPVQKANEPWAGAGTFRFQIPHDS